MEPSTREKIQGLITCGNLEGALEMLRNGGYSKVQSMKALVETRQFSFAEAKVVVHNSDAWRDVYQRDSEFHEQLGAAVRKAQPPRDD